ncbi:MAG: fibronectin type III domain-containing protein, partial [Cyclobacteriaceae bacterium]|nr:fibronectin type III domain-containing protein [Cyclobacteriaceae bacterium HetDA_MAG_MS6]
VSIEVNASADILTLVPTITLSNRAAISPASGVARDFSSAVDYVVTAEDNTTRQWTVTVDQVPSAPALSTTNNDVLQTAADLSWNRPSSAVSYSLEVSTSNDFSNLISGYDPLVIGDASTLSENITGLTSGTTYYARILATNGTGSSSTYSDTLTFLTRPADPVLTSVDLSDVGQQDVDFSWTAVSGQVDSYDIEVALSSDFSSLETGYPVNLTSTQFIIGSGDSGTAALVANTTYYIRVIAHNTTGSSSYSNTVSVLTKPEAPVINAIGNADVGQTNANVSWNSVFSSGGSYNIEVSSTDFTAGATILPNYPLNVTGTSVDLGAVVGTSALEPGTFYWVRIRASNASGESTNSNVVMILTRPSDPVLNDVSLTDIGQEEISFSWPAVAGEVDSYDLEVSLNSDFSSLASGYPVNLMSTEFNIGNETGTAALSANTTYFIRVLARNGTGNSNYSNTLSVLTKPETPVLNDVDNSNVGQSTATISWSSVFPSGGSYNVEVSSTDFSVGATILADYPLNVTGTSLTVGSDLGTSALETSTTYWIRLRASNTSGESPNSNSVMILTRPSTPAGLPASDITASMFTANWSAVDGAEGYILEVSGDNFASTVLVDSTTAISGSVSGLTTNNQYQFRVVAYNGTGVSSYSNQVLVTTNAVPTAISLTNDIVDENQESNATVGTILTTDINDDSHTYSLVSGEGDADNSAFRVDGTVLRTNTTFNFEVRSEYSVRIQTRDPAGDTFADAITIRIEDINDAPVDISITNLINPTGYDSVGTKVGDLVASDEDDNQHTFKMIEGGESFQIVNNTTLETAAVFENEVDSTINVVIQAIDPDGDTVNVPIAIEINAFIDTTDPDITLETNNPTAFLSGGSAVTIGARVVDFRLEQVQFFSRLLTDTEFTSTLVTSQTDVYTVTIQEVDLGVAGIEYYFEAIDVAGNMTTSSVSKLALEFPATGTESPVIESVQKFGRTVDKYQIISIPYTFSGTNNKVDVIFNEYNGGVPDNRTWRVIRFDNGLAELVNLTASSQIALGEGYFFIAEEQKEIRVGQASINVTDPYPIDLEAGWNLIGNPYNVDIDWSAVLARNGVTGTVRNLRVLDPANPETWPESNVLKKFEGAFVQADQNITINISYQDVLPDGGRLGGIVSQDPDIDWYLPISLEQSGDIRKAGVGMDREARTSLDRFDQLVLPRWLEYLEISFLHPEEKFGRYNRDVVPAQESNIWDFEISSSKNGPSTLKWDASQISTANLRLLNKETGEIVDMNQTTDYHFELNEKAGFSILYSQDPDDQFRFDQVSVLDAYPNPFDQSFNIPVRLPEMDANYSADITVMDLSGKTLWRQQLQDLTSGAHELQVTTPGSIAPGVYLYQVMINNKQSQNIYTKRITVK